jgi:hypothetical protein
MHRIAKGILILVIAGGILQSVSDAQHLKTVVWSGDSACGWKNAAVNLTEVYRCTSTETPRGSVSSVVHNNVSLAVAFLDRDDLITVAVEITNRNPDPLMFDAENWGAAHFRGREDFISGKKPIIAETSIPSRDVTRQISRRATSDNSVDEYLADIQQTIETVEVRKPDGTRVRVKKTVPDVEQQQTAESRSESRTMLAKNSTEQMRRNSLTAKTVVGNGFVRGLIYFRRVKKAKYVVFSMTLDDTNYLFLLPRTEN